MTRVTIRHADGQRDMAAVHRLCWAYRDALIAATTDRPEIVETYYSAKDYGALLMSLPARHARPDGAILVAEHEGQVVACAMLHRIDAGTAEIKRVFVDDAVKGLGIGRQICIAAMDQAKADGYSRMALDTMRPLTPAIRLYESLGFAPCPPFYPPDPEVGDYILFLGRTL